MELPAEILHVCTPNRQWADQMSFWTIILIRVQMEDRIPGEQKSEEESKDFGCWLTCSCWRVRPLVFRGGALSARYFCFSSSFIRISCSSSSLALATIRLCTQDSQRMKEHLHAWWKVQLSLDRMLRYLHLITLILTMITAAPCGHNGVMHVYVKRCDLSYLQHQLPWSWDLGFSLEIHVITQRIGC